MNLPNNSNSADDLELDPQLRSIDLRDRKMAAFLAWFLPGLGHFYQRRYAKAALFSICILGTFFYGFALGDGKVVYYSLRQNDIRYCYFFQVGAGLPALPALVQGMRSEPLGTFMAPPRLSKNDPGGVEDDLHSWNYKMPTLFEMGSVYTTIAGLLNLLAIYDAYAGPLILISQKKKSSSEELESASKSREQIA